MYECVMGLREFKGNGCILADDMGYVCHCYCRPYYCVTSWPGHAPFKLLCVLGCLLVVLLSMAEFDLYFALSTRRLYTIVYRKLNFFFVFDVIW